MHYFETIRLSRGQLSYSDHSVRVYLNWQYCEKGLFFTKTMNKMVPEKVFFLVCHSERGMFFLTAHVYPRKA